MESQAFFFVELKIVVSHWISYNCGAGRGNFVKRWLTTKKAPSDSEGAKQPTTMIKRLASLDDRAFREACYGALCARCALTSKCLPTLQRLAYELTVWFRCVSYRCDYASYPLTRETMRSYRKERMPSRLKQWARKPTTWRPSRAFPNSRWWVGFEMVYIWVRPSSVVYTTL